MPSYKDHHELYISLLVFLGIQHCDAIIAMTRLKPPLDWKSY